MEHVVSYRIKAIDDITPLQRKVNTLNEQSQVGFKKLGTKIDQVNAPTRRLLGNLNSVGTQGVKATGSLMAGFGKMKNMLSGPMIGAMAGAFSIGKIVQFGGQVVSTLGKFEKFEAVLTNTLGSNSAARQVMDDITKLAARTPFEVDGLTDAWVRLANQGFKPTMQQMTQLGDLSSSTGKDIGMLSEAVLDAMVGENERLKEFGIKAEQSGKKTIFTFKGVRTEVDRNAQAIQEYLVGLGNVKGVQGAMAAISKSTEGQLSNLSDKYTSLKHTIGKGLKPVIEGVIEFMGKLIDKFNVHAAWLQKNEALVKRFTTNALTKMWQVVEHIGKAIGVMIGFWQKNGDTIVDFAKTAWRVLGPILGLLIKMGMWVMKFYSLFYGTLIKVWKTAFQIGKNIIGFFGEVKNGISSFFEWMEEKIGVLGTIIKHVLILPLLPYIAIFKGVKAITGKKKKEENTLDKRLTELPGNKMLENVGLLSSGDKGLLGTPRVEDKLFSLPGNDILRNSGILNGSTGPGLPKRPSEDEILFGKDKVDVTSKEKTKSLSDRATEVKGVVSGEIKHITINIQKLVETLMIKTEKLGMSESQVKPMVTRVLLSAVNDIQQSN